MNVSKNLQVICAVFNYLDLRLGENFLLCKESMTGSWRSPFATDCFPVVCITATRPLRKQENKHTVASTFFLLCSSFKLVSCALISLWLV